jgi:hypothetical protein
MRFDLLSRSDTPNWQSLDDFGYPHPQQQSTGIISWLDRWLLPSGAITDNISRYAHCCYSYALAAATITWLKLLTNLSNIVITSLTALITVILRRYQPSITLVFKWMLNTSNRNWNSLHEGICICTHYRRTITWINVCYTPEYNVRSHTFAKCNHQDATLLNLFISIKCSACFRRFLCPSSGAETVHTASCNFQTLQLPDAIMVGMELQIILSK